MWGQGIGQGAALAAILAYAVNHPHFANSYQIFYRSFKAKLFSQEHSIGMRVRFFIAGIAVPIAFAFIFLAGFLGKSPVFLGYTVNAMFFFVGWHYVKQGYGALIVCSVMRKQFFSTGEKRVFLANAFAAWFYSWVNANAAVNRFEYWDIPYSTFMLPPFLQQAGGMLLIFTSVLTVAVLVKKDWSLQSRLPWNGIVAYFSALYIWTAFVQSFHKDAFLFIPAFHSLQYLIMVWKYENNRVKDVPSPLFQKIKKYWYIVPAGFAFILVVPIAPENWLPNMNYQDSVLLSLSVITAIGLFFQRLFSFLTGGIILGFLGFWLLPVWLMGSVPYDYEIFGSALFPFFFWIFINIHHYFMDSVIWRKENPDVKRYLFRTD